MSMYHGGMTMAQAVGDEPLPPLTFVPGVDFDPYDEDERDIVSLAMERDRHDRMAALERENANLRARVAELEGHDDV